MNRNEDKRPDPKPRKRPLLWQAYLHWDELVKMRQRHNLRISSIERGKSNLDAGFEHGVLERMGLDDLIKHAKKEMVGFGANIGPAWDWLTSIKGLGAGGLAAQLSAQIDDIGKFATVSKLWMFSGHGLRDGQVVRCKRGEKSPYNRRLKSIVYLVVEQFIRHRTPVYAEIYYAEKERQRRNHPQCLCRECSSEAKRTRRTPNELATVIELDEAGDFGPLLEEIDVQFTKYAVRREDCPEKKQHHMMFNDGHLHHRAMRKTGKIFLQHLWLKWRESEGLSISKPYAEAMLGHTNIVQP